MHSPATHGACKHAPYSDAQGTAELIKLVRFIADKPDKSARRGRFQTVEFHYNDKSTWNLWPGKISFHKNHDEHLHFSVGAWHPYTKAEEKTILSQPVAKSLAFFLKDRWFRQQEGS